MSEHWFGPDYFCLACVAGAAIMVIARFAMIGWRYWKGKL